MTRLASHERPSVTRLATEIVYLSLCEVGNHIRRFSRPAWIAHRDFSPIQKLADDCLIDLAQQLQR